MMDILSLPLLFLDNDRIVPFWQKNGKGVVASLSCHFSRRHWIILGNGNFAKNLDVYGRVFGIAQIWGGNEYVGVVPNYQNQDHVSKWQFGQKLWDIYIYGRIFGI